MANSAGISTAAKLAALAALVDGKTIKCALYLSSATTGPTNTVYTATGELAATGNYAAGGASVTNGVSAALDGSTAHWTPGAAPSWTNLTSSGAFNCAMLYSTTDANRNLGTYTFGDQNISAGSFSLTLPTNNGTTGLIRIG